MSSAGCIETRLQRGEISKIRVSHAKLRSMFDSEVTLPDLRYTLVDIATSFYDTVAIGADELSAVMDTCAAVRSATSRNARAAAESGSASMIGRPLSPPSRIGW